MTVTSAAFKNNETIPKKYTGFGEDISPDLTVTGAPEGTASFAVVLDDLDVPFQKIYTHWVIWNLPPAGVIPEGLPWGAVIGKPVSACQGTAWGKNRYRGPKPPFFMKTAHRYVFTVYALDCLLDIPESSDRKALIAAMDGHILDKADITGKFKRG